MPHGKAPVPRKAGGRREEQSLLVRACRVFVDNYANLLRFGLVVGGLYLVSTLPEQMSGASNEPADTVAEQLPVIETPPPAAPDPFADETFLTEGVQRALNCTKREYQREHYSDCGLEESDVYRQEEIFKDDGTLTILDVETLYAEAQ